MRRLHDKYVEKREKIAELRARLPHSPSLFGGVSPTSRARRAARRRSYRARHPSFIMRYWRSPPPGSLHASSLPHALVPHFADPLLGAAVGGAGVGVGAGMGVGAHLLPATADGGAGTEALMRPLPWAVAVAPLAAPDGALTAMLESDSDAAAAAKQPKRRSRSLSSPPSAVDAAGLPTDPAALEALEQYIRTIDSRQMAPPAVLPIPLYAGLEPLLDYDDDLFEGVEISPTLLPSQSQMPVDSKPNPAMARASKLSGDAGGARKAGARTVGVGSESADGYVAVSLTEEPPAAEAGQSRLYRPKREAQSSISKHEHIIKQRGFQARLKTRSQGGSTSGDERAEHSTLDASCSNPKSKKCASASAAGGAEHQPQKTCASSKKTHSKTNKPTKGKKQNRSNSIEERRRIKRALEQFERWRQNYALQQNYLRRILEAISFEACMREQQERLSAASGSASVLPPPAPASDSIAPNSVAIPIAPPSTYIGPAMPLPRQLFEQSDPSRAGPGPSTLSNMQRELLDSMRTQASAPPISDRSALSTSIAFSAMQPLPALSAANSAYPAPYPLLPPFMLPPFPLPHGDWQSYPRMSANQASSSHAASSRGARPVSMPPFDLSQSLGRQVANRMRSAARPSSVPPEGVDTICEADDDEEDESELDESAFDPALDEDEFDLVAASLGNSAGSQAFDIYMRAPHPHSHPHPHPHPHRSFAGLSAPHAMDDEGVEAIPRLPVGAWISPLSSPNSSPSVAECEPPPPSVAVRVIAEPPPSSSSALLESPTSPTPERSLTLTLTGALELHERCDEPPAELRLAVPTLRDELEVAGAGQFAPAFAPAAPFDPLLPSVIYIDQSLTTPTHQPSASSLGSIPI